MRYSTDTRPLENENVKTVINAVKKRLGKKGRLVIRPSGTEPLIRIMTEAEDKNQMLEAGQEVAEAVRNVSA